MNLSGNAFNSCTIRSTIASSDTFLTYQGTAANCKIAGMTFTDVNASGSAQALDNWYGGTLTRTTNIINRTTADFATAAQAGVIISGNTISLIAGTYHEALVAEVLAPTTFGAGSALTGTYTPDFPAVDAVLTTDTVNGSAGHYHAPEAAEVISTATYGVDGATAGTFDEAARNTDPTEALVITGTAYKICNVAKTGTFNEAARNTDPTEAKVLAPTAYKILNVAKVGTYAPDFPAVGNVTEDDTVNGSAGTYHEAAEAEVQAGVTFGAGEALTGTYAGGGGGKGGGVIGS
jgi:hypothetical protein